MAEVDQELLASVFEERAEYLSKTELSAWTIITARDREIIAKLTGPGAKLLIGPRGCGKSTLLRHSYFQINEKKKDLAVYVNYSRSLALEPMFHKTANALQLFRQWVLVKIAVGVGNTILEEGLELPPTLVPIYQKGRDFIRELEAGLQVQLSGDYLTPSTLLSLLESWAARLDRKRLILLLDDAAHAFSPEQQREFFEVFRELRSRIVSAKAAVYPGITSYSPYFHVGHEAEVVQAWYKPEDEDYLYTMREIADRRLPNRHKRALRGREDLVDYVALACFGIPRGFLVMLSQLLGIEEGEPSATPTRLSAERAVSDHADSVKNVFTSLASKLSRYSRFVEVGNELALAMTQSLQAFNVNKGIARKAVTVAFPVPIGPEVNRMLQMLEYAGIVRDAGSVSRGEKGVFNRYILHYGFVITGNALSLGKSFSLVDVVAALTQRNAHAFVRVQAKNLLGLDYANRCTLDLAPCENCGAPRPSEDALFCMRCGQPLKTASVYDELIKAPIDRLPLTKNKIQGLKKYTGIRTVNDVLLDEDYTQIRSVPSVGPIWSARIRRYAEEFVSV
ncbi:zinc ribbon domain-containing protein [Amycolatopsis sp. WAC 04169]|uniref:zinc ribbon domain-containing protein n=1 Tax=Amycolatopsis sp. WAC 04169 TaxID=2203197 RepID=UPI000F7A8F6A|nr:zinc ribbon domain-containing protein [Amycolatopsis sp. WAC 04169]